jgi:hypothetical protein
MARQPTTDFDKMIQARLDCLIFFEIAANGWGKVLRNANGHPCVVYNRLRTNERLNFPSYRRLVAASKRVREGAGEQAAEYKRLFKVMKEAHRRWKATATKASWNWYVSGAERARAYAISASRGKGLDDDAIRKHECIRYLADELLPRLAERKRARAEIKQAMYGMVQKRAEIFDAMGVPMERRK